ncbi:uncharacterized protein LOC132818491 [Hemiscyllium ocellatum]|uniref:uncharacterized protein LOC132818491 n=1 Tax=Hemiscyllium ocellatum TaxID=170820 RepID=UPI00296769A5|nr:uncharacterized protein LOC132818491 [Hemiscyllium ocellatum]
MDQNRLQPQNWILPLLERRSSRATGSCRFKRSSKPLQVAVINIDRIPAPTAYSVSKTPNHCMLDTTNRHNGFTKEQRLPPSGSLPSNPSSGGMNSQSNSARIGSNLPKAMQLKINHLVNSPFKHSTVSHLHHMHCFSPGEDWKFEILSEIEHIKKLQSELKPLHYRHLETGQLLKARLKPLYPVVVDGPSIAQCRGILPGASQTEE